MRKHWIHIIFLVAMVVVFSACLKNQPLDSDVPRYSNVDDVIDPPDEFILVYNMNTYNNYLAYIEFESNSVWRVERMSEAGFFTVWVERSDGSSENSLEIINATLDIYFVGFEADIGYNMWSNRTAGQEEYRTLLLKFTKQPNIDYSTFTPKI